MRTITRRADAAPSCFRAPNGQPEHVVVANPEGWFDVTSGRSGEVYRVYMDGRCTCKGYEFKGKCSHSAAVEEFAANVLRVLREQPEAGK